MSAHEMSETHEKIAEAGGHGHHEGGHGGSHNKRIAILISALAALLAIVEMDGKGAQTAALASNIESNDLWAFYQAKTMRSSLMLAEADTLALLAPAGLPADKAAAVARRVADWRATAKRYDSEPATHDGRKELMERAHEAEEHRDHAMHAYHRLEYASGAIEIGIVLASAAVVTGTIALAWVAAGAGSIGLVLAAMTWLPALTAAGGH